MQFSQIRDYLMELYDHTNSLERMYLDALIKSSRTRNIAHDLGEILTFSIAKVTMKMCYCKGLARVEVFFQYFFYAP